MRGTPLRWPLRRHNATPVIDYLVLSQAKAARDEEAYAKSLLDLRAWIVDSARAAGIEVGSSEYASTTLDPNAQRGLRALGFGVRRGAPPLHISHTYLGGSAMLDVIDRIVRGTASTYAGPHGEVLARYGRVTTAVYNLLAFDRDPRMEARTRTAAIWAFEKPPHNVMRYDAFDPLIGAFVEVTKDRSGSVSGAAWQAKLGLGPTPEYWVEWRCHSAFTLGELDDGFRAWRAPATVKAGAAAGWRLLATRIA